MFIDVPSERLLLYVWVTEKFGLFIVLLAFTFSVSTGENTAEHAS